MIATRPDSHPPSQREGAGRVVLSLVVAVAILAGYVLLHVRPHRYVGMTDHRLVMVQAGWNDAADVLFAGDSRSQAAYVPSVFSAGLGGRVLNFAQQGRRYSATYFAAIDRALDQHGVIPTIVLGVSPRSLTADSVPYSEQEQQFDPFDRWTTSHFDLLFAALKPMTKWDVVGLLRPGVRRVSECTPDGWVDIQRIPADPTVELPLYRHDFQEHRVDPELIDGLLRQVRRWTEQHVFVIGERTPTSAAMLQVEDELSGFDEREFSRRFEAAGGRWLTQVMHPAWETWDGSHITRAAAFAHSAALAPLVSDARIAHASRVLGVGGAEAGRR